MKKHNTLTDITTLMEKIGCFDNKYIAEQLNNEGSIGRTDTSRNKYYKRGSKDGMGKMKDEFNRIEITSSYAILYSCVRKSALDSILQNGLSEEFFGSSQGGAAWGRGIYTNFQLYQAWGSSFERSTYGTAVVKLKYHGNMFKKFLIAEEKVRKEPLSKQLENFPGLKEEAIRRGMNMSYLDAMSNKYHSSAGIGVILDTFRTSEALMKYGVEGIVFFGGHDGPVAVVFDINTLTVEGYIDNTKNRNSDSLPKYLKMKEGDGGFKGNNHLTPLLSRFPYLETNKQFSRPKCNILLLNDKRTGKKTFVDMGAIRNIDKDSDPRLFGDFEFEEAQNFGNEGGRELAYVKIDKDPNSYFYIDKKGNLYEDPKATRPISSIYDYYGGKNEPLNNEPLDNDDDDYIGLVTYGDDDDLWERINKKSQKIIDEARTETPDGHVELDNFDVARNIMDFSNPENAYFIQIAERHKDHPDRQYEHNACDYKTWFEVVSIDHLNAIEPVIKGLCQKGGWRAMLYLNPRNMLQTRDYAHNRLEKMFKKHPNQKHLIGHEVEVAYGQSKSGVDRMGRDWDTERPLCFVDVDNDDPKIHKQVVDYINKMGIKPLEMYKTTNNGLHIILPDNREARKLDFTFLDGGKDMGRWATAGLELDKSMTLYAYVKAKGYGVQKRMQQRLSRR